MDDPQARVALDLASAEIDRALHLARDDKNAEATQEIKRAHADAELAVSLAREAVLRKRAERAQRTLMATRQR
jgi:hypothetical protein